MSLQSAFDTPEHKRRYVRRLFATIAGRYDVATRVLSFGLDQRWKARLAKEARVCASDLAVDLACGTGDVVAHLRDHGVGRVIGLDVTSDMLVLARRRAADVAWVQGDMTALPLATATADLLTTAYGLRNVTDLDRALAEAARVLRPGGRFVALDFNRPQSPLVRRLYLGYLNVVGGLLGRVLHGDADTYRYIPASIRRYPGAAEVASRVAAHGFSDVRIVPLLFGLMSLHVATRTARPIDRPISVR